MVISKMVHFVLVAPFHLCVPYQQFWYVMFGQLAIQYRIVVSRSLDFVVVVGVGGGMGWYHINWVYHLSVASAALEWMTYQSLMVFLSWSGIMFMYTCAHTYPSCTLVLPCALLTMALMVFPPPISLAIKSKVQNIGYWVRIEWGFHIG